MEKKSQERERFSTGLAVFFATLSSAVGLGNIWKFPYLTGNYGGGAFLLIYFICIVLVALPVMISEMYIGRKTRKNPIGAIAAIKSRGPWKIIGYMGILSAFFILFFYSSVAGWVYSYIFKALSGTFANSSYKELDNIFNKTASSPVAPIIWQFVAIIVVASILVLGVKKGIERMTKVLMPVLLILIIICDIRALTLPGAMQGVAFIFKVDFSSITKEVILMALGLSFFKLSLGMGTIITYGSYFTSDNNMIATAGKVAVSDTIVSLLAGIAIFPAVFSFGMTPQQGPGLLFKTIPLVFSKVPFGGVLIVLFFVLSAIAATTAMLSMLEVVVTYFVEEKKVSRRKAVLLCSTIVLVIGTFVTMSQNGANPVSKIKPFGLSLFDFFDQASSNVLLPLGGLLIALFAGYVIDKKDMKTELSNYGELKNKKLIRIYTFLVRYITPVLLFIVFMSMIGVWG
ncbi:sodium:neurotransmitter symporter [Ruminiclostridium papyrosolvens DSM 2782]|uniref:Transporter n=1 Tax=Ruminiclostridium papyrosolvens DSM 2782 TaxID=588581 RepID=F1TC69_9FIRM|nr:sodium-dependent transporter [Ruminiclostridium papyrosolvens]EGD47984.1 sodium:neurotransmitter symporter [Ruminiclostridium papyrosolvens DSM 2782]WES35125.1 sodium-dependent transporter [Ruminiclostridium papyrosolvens DSM 2782]